MLLCQFMVVTIGVTIGFNRTHIDAADNTIANLNSILAINAPVTFIISFVFFASTWCLGRDR